MAKVPMIRMHGIGETPRMLCRDRYSCMDIVVNLAW